MDISAMLSDIKQHIELQVQHGEQLLASHVPALVELAGKIEQDPLVQTAINLVVPEASRQALAGILKTFEVEIQHVEADAKEAAAVAPVPDPEPAPEPVAEPAPEPDAPAA